MNEIEKGMDNVIKARDKLVVINILTLFILAITLIIMIVGC
jgi:hypothetical protein